jgi:lysophospholipase L1-like esterase
MPRISNDSPTLPDGVAGGRVRPASAISFLRNSLIVLGIAFGLYVVLDLAVGAIFGMPHPPIPDFNQIPALRGQPYVSPDFVAEYVLNDFLDAAPDDRLLWEPLHEGIYFNVEALPPTGAHYRRTANAPAGGKPVRTVLFLGASKVYGTEVPDNLTLPSLLSQRLSVLDPAHGYVVYNAGVQAVTSTEELWRLQYELDHGLKPDVVVLLDGGLDLVRGVYLGKSGKSAAVSRGFFGRLIHDYFPLNIYRWIRLWMTDRAISSRMRQPPAHLADPAKFDSLLRQTVAEYEANQRRMVELAAAHGARLVTALEPGLYSAPLTHPTADYAYADDYCTRRSPGFADAIRASWPALTETLRRLQGAGIETLDLSQAFQDKTVDIFVDCDHFNAIGNAILADRLADAILGRPATP